MAITAPAQAVGCQRIQLYTTFDETPNDTVRTAFRENTAAKPRPESPMTPERNAQMVANLLAMQSAFGRNK